MSLERRKPMKRGKGLRADPEKTREWQRRSRANLPAESAKRKAERPKRARVRQEVIERDRGCQARGILPGPCGGNLDVHEVIRRSRLPGSHLDADLAMAVCRLHHQWITEHDEEAKALGFSASAPQPGLTKYRPPD